jgi:hypothetical protein
MYFTVRQQLNFPNKYDAAQARKKGLIPPQLEAEIARAWQSRKLPPEDARLKRSIIINTRRESSLQIPDGSMVVILGST